jgi:hypothetical protein
LRGVAEGIRVELAQLLDHAIQVFAKLAIAAKRAAQFFCVCEPLAQFTFKLPRPTARRASGGNCSAVRVVVGTCLPALLARLLTLALLTLTALLSLLPLLTLPLLSLLSLRLLALPLLPLLPL